MGSKTKASKSASVAVPKVKMVVLPGNVALLSPPLESLPTLQRYRPFLLQDGGPAGGLVGDEVAQAQELSPCSALPAGLLPRLRKELTEAGHPVEVDDRRHYGEEFRTNKGVYEVSCWREKLSFLRAIRAHPQGQLVGGHRWHDMYWRLSFLGHLWPGARVLIVSPTGEGALSLRRDLLRYFREPLGVLTTRDVLEQGARCVITNQATLPRLRPASWQVVVLEVRGCQEVGLAAYRALVRGRAPRVYALVWAGASLGPRTRLRLEAMAGPLIDPPAPDAG